MKDDINNPKTLAIAISAGVALVAVLGFLLFRFVIAPPTVSPTVQAAADANSNLDSKDPSRPPGGSQGNAAYYMKMYGKR